MAYIYVSFKEESDQCCPYRNGDSQEHGAGKARFTMLIKEKWDHLCGTMAFNLKRVALSLRKREMSVAM
jgi:hypothetical protein